MTRPLPTAAAALCLLLLPAADAGGQGRTTPGVPGHRRAALHASFGAGKGRTLTVTATAYCNACDKSGKTATGRAFSKPGVAVDPRVIPLGSLVSVPGYNGGMPVVADDTGRLIKGRRIDVRLASRGRCARDWGKREVTVRVVRQGRKR